MRDRVIHDYCGLDYGIVWEVAISEDPDLANSLERVPEFLEKQSDEANQRPPAH